MYYPNLTLSLQALSDYAEKFVGVTEERKDNYGEWVETFQKSIGGVAKGEPWCVAFVQYCVKMVGRDQARTSQLFKTESAVELWNKTPEMCRIEAPIVGSIMVWQIYDDQGVPTGKGHAGIVKQVSNPMSALTIEGNTTNPLACNVGDFQGVYEKVRSVTGSKQMRVVGWLIPWA